MAPLFARLISPPEVNELSILSICYLNFLEKTKLAGEISDGKNEIPHKFLGRKI